MKEDIKYAGIDLHQSTCLIEVQDQRGEALSQTVLKVANENKRNRVEPNYWLQRTAFCATAELQRLG